MGTGSSRARCMHRCFMTGRNCIHEEEISKKLDETGHENAFVVIPFTADLEAMYNWQIKPYLENGECNGGENYKVQRADDVWQVGFIICTKICRQIQMADLVVVDVTYDNPNVFYEFGISAALRKDILPVAVEKSETFKKERAKHLALYYGIDNGKRNEGIVWYPDFGYMRGNIRENTYNLDQMPDNINGDKILILYESGHDIPIQNKYGLEKVGAHFVERYNFGKICNTATSAAAKSIFYPDSDGKSNNHISDTILRYRKKIAQQWGQRGAECTDKEFIENMVTIKDLSTESFTEVVKAIKAAGCIIIDIRHQDPRAFFWLGYLHAIGVHVIPVNAVIWPDEKDPPFHSTMAFDIAGLWYAQFNPKEPLIFQTTLYDILGYVFDEKARQLQKDAFWTNILHDQPISVFLGTVSEETLGRNSLGDWDYRSAAEITSFLSHKSHKIVLENPIIKPNDPDSARSGASHNYLDRLKTHIENKNCIIIGSADINELTEVVWATIHGHQPFKRISKNATCNDREDTINCFIALKEYADLKPEDKKKLFGYGREGMASFSLEEGKAGEEKRGFNYRDGNAIQARILQQFMAHKSSQNENSLKLLYGQLIVCRNPWSPSKWIIMINGTSGPATLGITQMLTGCQYEDFTINTVDRNLSGNIINLWFGTKENQKEIETVNYNTMSENLLTQCLSVLENDSNGFEGIIEVGVYYPSNELLYDERKVVGWRFTKIKKRTGGDDVPNPRKRDWYLAD